MKFRHGLMASCCLSATLSLAGATLAQTPGGSASTVDPSANSTPGTAPSGGPGAAASTTLSEIVVTSQKRAENLQNVPISITAVSQDALDRAGVRDFADIQKAAPDVKVDDVVGATNISIRGVRQSALGPTADTPTAVHLDGVYLSRSTGLTGLFYDVQRMEVLAGPQGTLYGRNATGGVVNVITNKPTDIAGSNIEAELGNYNLYRVQGAINAPVTDYLDLRGAFHFYGHDGFYSNGLDDANEKGGRLGALIKFTPKAKLLLTGDYEVSDRKGPGQALLGLTYRSPSPPARPGGTTPQGIPVPSDPFDASSVLYPYGPTNRSNEYSRIYGFMGQFDYDLDFATLTAQAGYRSVDFNSFTPAEGTTIQPTPLVLPPNAPRGAQTYGYTASPAASDTTSMEIRLASNATRPLQWVVGGYFFTEDANGDLCAAPNLTANYPVCAVNVANPKNRTESYAVFGQTTYTPPILDNALHLITGLRANTDKKTADTFEALFGGAPVPTNGKASFDALTYRVGGSYDLTPRNNVYGTVSTGFRAGGFAYGSSPAYKPETIIAYEIGSKNRFLDNRLQINVSAFHYDYKNIETNVLVLPPPQLFFLPFTDITVQSIGGATYTGASLESEFAVTRNDRLELDGQYLNARYTKFVIPAKYANTPPLGLNGFPNREPIGVYSGDQLINTPHWTGTAAYDHMWDMLNGAFDARAAVQFSTDRDFSTYPRDSLQYAVNHFPGYARVDLSLRYTPERGKWTLTGYVDNVADARTVATSAYELNNTPGFITGTLFPPRQFGAIFTARY